MSAIELNARASSHFAEKLAETQALLQRAAKEFSPVTQASSLGAEDVVITHLINRLQLRIPVFVLETGALHHETLALLERSTSEFAKLISTSTALSRPAYCTSFAKKVKTPFSKAWSNAKPVAIFARWNLCHAHSKANAHGSRVYAKSNPQRAPMCH